MKVQKRDGRFEGVSFDKILSRLNSLASGPEFSKTLDIDVSIVAQQVVQELCDGITTVKLDELSSQVAISMYSKHPHFKDLASRIAISNHHKNTKGTFSEKMAKLYWHQNQEVHSPLIADYLHELVRENKDLIDDYIDYNRDYHIDFFGFKTLEKSYLFKVNGQIIEAPQDMFMRVSLSIHRNNIDKAFETYDYMSNQFFIHATPTLYNGGSRKEQYASCFLLSMKEDSISGIYDTLKDCALISKHSGGIGLSAHTIRANNSFIAGTNGKSNGLVPMLRVFNDTARYVDQGGGKRNGSFAVYLEPWHADIEDFLELKKNHGNELERARDLFYALWIPDLFMEQVQNNGDWYLFCPNECPGLNTVHSEEFVQLYNKYVDQKKYRKKILARDLWTRILNTQLETGTPYLLYKDSCNSKSNQQNLGTIQSSNLCTEIIEYTDQNESAVCNLASISLKKFIVPKDYSGKIFLIYSKPNCVYCDLAKGLMVKNNITFEEKSYKDILLSGEYPTGIKFPQIYIKDNNTHIGGYTELEDFLRPDYDFNSLEIISGILTRNLNNIIDYNYYPIPETKRSNKKHRPIGIGVQGLANVFFEMNYAFDSDGAKELNDKIFETIYYGSMKESMKLAKEREKYMLRYKQWMNQVVGPLGENGDDFVSSDEYNEIMKHLQDVLPEEYERDKYLGSYSTFIGSPLEQGKFQFDLWDYNMTDIRHNWSELKEDIMKYGTRNSLLVAPMPTASTSQIMGNYECFEPITSNIYTRRVLSGEYTVLNDYLIYDLISLNMWNNDIKQELISNDGSIQQISGIPNIIKDRYKTVWEMKQKPIVDMAADRGKYICQSQSLNLFLSSPSVKALTSMHFYGWKKGLKTGIYYLRSQPSSKAIKFTIDPNACESCSA
tara:strand:+ start:8171 stop:10846 length:2676 start_codon:yes stop_codon:yes gene_type:complete